MTSAMWWQIVLAATISGMGRTKFIDSSDSDSYELGTAHSKTTSKNDILSPFATDGPSETLFKRKDGLDALAPITNVAGDLFSKPIPTNEWWGNLINRAAAGVTTDAVGDPAWSNPYALKLPTQAPFGLQACYSYTYRQMADEVDGVIRYYLHEFHNDMTLSKRVPIDKAGL